MNFDANWYHHLFDEEKRAAYEADRNKVSSLGMHDDYTCTDIEAMEAIARQVPLSHIQRPEWDRQASKHASIHSMPYPDVPDSMLHFD